MAKTLTLTLRDPDATVRAGAPILSNVVQDMAESMNWQYANLRRPIFVWDFNRTANGLGVLQGTGSPESTTTGSLVDRFIIYYDARAVPDDIDIITFTAETEASASGGKVQIDWDDSATTSVAISPASGEQRTSATVSSSTFKGDGFYTGTLSVQAPGSGDITLRRITVHEGVISSGDMP